MYQITAEEILTFIKSNTDYQINFSGSPHTSIDHFCSFSNVSSNSITWIKNPVNQNLSVLESVADVLVIVKSPFELSNKTISFFLTPEPKAVFFRVLEHFWAKPPVTERADTAVIESSNLDDTVSVGHHSFIGKDVSIGPGTSIGHNVSIFNPVTIGSNCQIHSGTVIGSDGFGYFIDHDGIPQKVGHYGGVEIGNDVEIGACSCIDRGTLDNTVIKDHCKIDNLVHIAHNVKLEESVMVIAGSVICGSAVLKKKSYVAPGGIVKNQLEIGENALVGMGAVVTKSVVPNTVVVGNPAQVLRQVQENDK